MWVCLPFVYVWEENQMYRMAISSHGLAESLYACWEDKCFVMLVDTNHWRAAIASFCLSLNTKANMHLQVRPFSMYLSISKLYIVCCILVLISTPILPLTMVVQIAANFSCYPNTRFLHVFAGLYSSVKAIVYVLFELIKRVPILFLDPYKCMKLKSFYLRYTYIYATCLVCYTLHL